MCADRSPEKNLVTQYYTYKLSISHFLSKMMIDKYIGF